MTDNQTETSVVDSEKVSTKHIFKTRRQTNRDIINSSIKKKINALVKKVDAISCHLNIIETGETEYMPLDKLAQMTVKINTTNKLTKSMKILISVTSIDIEPGGLICYHREFENNIDGDNYINAVVENTTETPRQIKFTYIICN